MGKHAFDNAPAHCAAYLRITEPIAPDIRGVETKWNMPLVRHSADLGSEALFPGVDHYVMTLHLGGAAVQRIDRPQLSQTASTGRLSLQAPGNGGTFRFRGAVDYAHFYFKQSLLCEVGDELGLGEGVELDDFFAEAFGIANDEASAYASRALDAEDPASSLEMDARAFVLVDSLLRALVRPHTHIFKEVGAVVREDVRAAIELIESDLSVPLRLSALAQAAGLSVYHFARVFRAVTGETPAEFLMRRRTERARERIVGSGTPFADIAYELGFSSQSHMNRHIRQRFGTTPTDIRRDFGRRSH